MEWYMYLIISVAGFIAGFINVLAGSGSLITLPLLMFVGLPANVANGTNRIAILLQNVIGVSTFKQQKLIRTNDGIKLIIPSVLGAVIGANLAINLNEYLMKMAIAFLMFVMFFIILLKPDKWVKEQVGLINKKLSVFQYIVFFFIGLYGGFIQAGVGFFLLSGLVLSVGYDLLRANAMKLLIVLAYTPFALAVFMYNDQIDYPLGFTLAIGNMLGAFIASRYASKIGNKIIRYILLVIILLSALKLLNFYTYIYNLF